MWRALTFILRPAENFRWRADVKFDRPGFCYDHIHPDYQNGFRTLFFITEEMVHNIAPIAFQAVIEEMALRYHRHLFPELGKS